MFRIYAGVYTRESGCWKDKKDELLRLPHNARNDNFSLEVDLSIAEPPNYFRVPLLL